MEEKERSHQLSPSRRDRDKDRERDKHRHREHRRSRSHSKSRSPRAHKHQKTSHDSKRDERREDRDGHRSRRHHHHRHDRDKHRDKPRDPVQLPHAARALVASADFSKFSPVFALYLSQEKHLKLSELQSAGKDREVQSRWRRFVDKWNARELADRWYEPQLFLRAVKGGPVEVERLEGKDDEEEEEEEDSEDDSDYGPALPPAEGTSTAASIRSRHLGASGPAIPSRADLDEKRALEEEDREQQRLQLRQDRRADRALQRERLEELVPRAAAGTRERQLEKKRELNEKMRGFRDKSPGGEVGDDELMGDDGFHKKSAQDRKKEEAEAAARRTFWQLRREEEQRAREEELAERRAQYRAREEETMDMLRELARQRFG